MFQPEISVISGPRRTNLGPDSPDTHERRIALKQWLEHPVTRQAAHILKARSETMLREIASLDPATHATHIARAQGQLALIEYLTSPALKSDLLA